MGRAVVKLAEDEYVEWSTVVDAPVTSALEREAAAAAWGADRVQRADVYGTSFMNRVVSTEDMLSCNRAGPGESELTLQEIREKYRKDTS